MVLVTIVTIFTIVTIVIIVTIIPMVSVTYLANSEPKKIKKSGGLSSNSTLSPKSPPTQTYHFLKYLKSFTAI